MDTDVDTVAAGELTAALNGRGLLAVPAGVVKFIVALVNPTGTLVDIAVALDDSRPATGTVSLNSTELLAAAASNEAPTMVTMVPGSPPGGEKKAMRGPPNFAIRVALKVPLALLPD